jgi:hypothetical protein
MIPRQPSTRENTAVLSAPFSWNADGASELISAMGLETLKNAERAAGFAMAASDEPNPESKPETKPEAQPWRPGEAVLARNVPKTGHAGELVRSLLSIFGRGAPA